MLEHSATLGNKLVALVGPPNSGKTTLYNWLTNANFKTVNYPGATVEFSIGKSRTSLGDPSFRVMDTPGTYSLFPKSTDEEITLKALYQKDQIGEVSHVIIVVDGTQLERHLLLAKQIQEAGFSCVIAATMLDLLGSVGVELSEKVLAEGLGLPVVRFNGVTGDGLLELGKVLQELPAKATKLAVLKPWSELEFTQKSESIKKLAKMSVSNAAKLHEIFSPTKKLDQVLLSPLFGLPLFFLIMATLFSSIFWLAKPFMDLFDFAFSSLQSGALAVLPTGLFSDFLANGIIASFGSVAVFIPQIYILFFGIGILESSGYLARASTLVDRPFSKIGLSGRSFVPLLSGFACAVPALMATRNISSPRDRWITNFIIPLMTCSARLPVYALLLGFLFHDSPAWVAGLWLAGLYFLSLFVGVLAAALLNRFLAKDKMSFFMMELPLYRKPRLRVLFKQSFERTKNYAVKAGPVIFTFAVLIWLGTSFPNYQAATAQEKLQTSYFAKAGQYAEPIFKPMGVDWRVGVGLMSAFAAREVFVSSLALVFNIDAGDKTNELSQSHSLQLAMREAKSADGTPIFTTASVCGLILFFMIALQCMSTFSVAIRETRSWKLPVAQLVFFNLIAYGLAVSVVQIHNFLAR